MTWPIRSILLVFAVSACGSEDPVRSPAAASLAGTYVTQSMAVTFGGTAVTMGPPEAIATLTLTRYEASHPVLDFPVRKRALRSGPAIVPIR